MIHINFVLDVTYIICLYLYIYIFLTRGGCHVTVALLAHDYITF